MKKFLLTLFLLADLILVIGVSAFLFFYVQGKPLPIPDSLMPIRLPTRASPVTSVAASTSTVVSTPPLVLIPPPPGAGGVTLRNLRFTYKNSKAKEVSIRADFTGWRAKPMVRDSAGVWIYDDKLAPGEYAYAFAVNNGDRISIIPDPASKRSKMIGQNKVSSIEVKPAPSK